MDKSTIDFPYIFLPFFNTKFPIFPIFLSNYAAGHPGKIATNNTILSGLGFKFDRLWFLVKSIFISIRKSFHNSTSFH